MLRRKQQHSAAARWQRCSKIDVEDRHREVVGQLALFFVLIDDAEKLVLEVNFSGIVLPRARLDNEGLIEIALQIGLELADFFRFHDIILVDCLGIGMAGFWHTGRKAVNPACAGIIPLKANEAPFAQSRLTLY